MVTVTVQDIYFFGTMLWLENLYELFFMDYIRVKIAYLLDEIGENN